tara:strand:- start:103 stop:264 length:162 start_codon:yes stop_codon:yes gene_type:complete
MSKVKKVVVEVKGSLVVPAGGYLAELGKIYVIKSEGYDEIKKDKSKKKLGRGK